MTARLRLHLGPTGLGQVELDGQDISAAINGVDLHSRVGEGTQAVLHLPAVELDGEADVRLHLSDATRALLVAHGWTPPEPESACICTPVPARSQVLQGDRCCPTHGEWARP